MAAPEIGGTAIDVTNDDPYEVGARVDIKADPNPGWDFVNWTGDYPTGVPVC